MGEVTWAAKLERAENARNNATRGIEMAARDILRKWPELGRYICEMGSSAFYLRGAVRHLDDFYEAAGESVNEGASYYGAPDWWGVMLADIRKFNEVYIDGWCDIFAGFPGGIDIEG